MNKLYYDSAYIKEFEAQVLSCQEGKKAGKQIEEMKNENVDMPDQGVNGFDFEWKD